MKRILVSYKHEDKERVTALIHVLQQQGLEVWWDRDLQGGEAWREHIETELNQAGCVIVVWSSGSVGPDGGFVRDEASRAKARGVLVPVRIERVSPPLGFGEIQAIDLSNWRGRAHDPAIADLVAACRAKLEGRPVPLAKAPGQALFRRAAMGSGVAAAALGAATFSTNMFASQTKLCTLPFDQPSISDTCGALHLGGRPSQGERIAWAGRPAGSCQALRDLINRYPDGAYRSEAAALLQAAKLSRAPNFSPDPRTAKSYVRQSERPFATQAAAQADALARATADASETACAPVDDTERLAGVDIGRTTFDCRPSPFGGWACAADYTVTCRIETRAMTETCG
jgi:hypothetical protein